MGIEPYESVSPILRLEVNEVHVNCKVIEIKRAKILELVTFLLVLQVSLPQLGYELAYSY